MGAPHLLYGPDVSALRTRAFERVAASSNPSSVWLLDSNRTVHDDHRAAWERSSDRDRLQLRVADLPALVGELHDRLVAPHPELDPTVRRRLIEVALESVDAIEDATRYRDPIAELLRALEAEGHTDPDAVDAALDGTSLPSARTTPIAEAAAAFQGARDRLDHPSMVTRAERLQNLAEADGAVTDALPYLEHVVIAGLDDPSPLELAVIDRIADDVPVTVLLPMLTGDTPSDLADLAGTDSHYGETLDALEAIDATFEHVPADDTPLASVARRLFLDGTDTVDCHERISHHEAPTPDREIRHVARRLRRLLGDDGVDPEDVLVVVPGLLSYLDGIDDAFTAAELPYAHQVGVLLERTTAGRAGMDALALADDPTLDRLVRLVANPLVTPAGIDTSELIDRERRLSVDDIGSLAGHLEATDPAALDVLLERVEAVRTASGITALEAYGALLDHLELAANTDALTVDDSVDGPRRRHRERAIGYEQRAIEQVQAIVESVARVCDDPTERRVQSRLEQALEGVRVVPPRQATEGCLRVVGLEDIRLADADHLVVLGATEAAMSGTRHRQRSIQAVADALGLLPRHATRDRHRHHLATALANATTVHLTTPAATPGGDAVVPAAVLTELRRVAEITETEGVADEPRATLEDVQRSLAGASPAELEASLDEASPFDADQRAAMLAGARLAAARGQPRLTAYDGQVDDTAMAALDDRLTKRPYSASRLNRYASCGFKYLMSEGYRLREPEPIEPEVDHFAPGSLLHATLEHFYDGLLERDGAPVDLHDYERHDLERALLDAGVTAMDDLDADFDSPFDRRLLEGIFAGLAPSSNSIAPDTDGTGLLCEYLRRALDESGWATLATETQMGAGDPITIDGEVIPVHGYIDRLDTDGAAARVIDYKSSNTDTSAVIEGADFQLLTYLLGAGAAYEAHRGTPPSTLDATFWILSPPDYVRHKWSVADRLESLGLDVDRFLAELGVPRVHEAVEAIETGAFQPAVVGPDEANCAYCAFADACDVRHHRRFEAISAIDAQDSPAYVPDGARPADLESLLRQRGLLPTEDAA